MKIPSIHTAESVKKSDSDAQYAEGEWTPARPMSYDAGLIINFLVRLQLAWGVFTGKYDALDWRDRHE